MPAVSKAQQHLMGMVRAYQKGELDTSSIPKDVLKKVRSMSGSMSRKEVKKFASTKSKNLPDHVTENVRSVSFKDFLILNSST